MSDFSAVQVGDTNLDLVVPKEGSKDPERSSTKVVRVTRETIVCSVEGHFNMVFDRETGVCSGGAEHGRLEFRTA